MHIEKKTLRNIFIGVGACIVLYWILNEFSKVKVVFQYVVDMLTPFIIGAILAFIINVPMRTVEKWLVKVKNATLRRTLALLITMIGILLILTVVFLLLIPQLIDTIKSLVPKSIEFFVKIEETLIKYVQRHPNLMNWLGENATLENLNIAEIAQKAITWLGDSSKMLLSGALNLITDISSIIFDVVIGLVFAVYCLYQKENLSRQSRKVIYAYLPEKICDGIVRVMRLTNATFSNFLSGQCVEVVILGSMFAVSMAIFRMPYIPLVSVLIAITAFIPIVGAWIGMVVGTFLIFVTSPMQAIWFAIMFVVLQQIENNLIYPHVVGTSIGLSGMWVLVAVAVGGELLGVVGMFLMIPIASVIYTLLRETVNKKLSKLDINEEKLKAQPPEEINHLKGSFRIKKKKDTNKQQKEKL